MSQKNQLNTHIIPIEIPRRRLTRWSKHQNNPPWCGINNVRANIYSIQATLALPESGIPEQTRRNNNDILVSAPNKRHPRPESAGVTSREPRRLRLDEMQKFAAPAGRNKVEAGFFGRQCEDGRLLRVE